MPNINKVIIIGAGPAGLIAAIRLHKENHIPNIVIYEIRHEPATIGGAVGIPSNGLRLFDRMGFYDTVKARGGATGTAYFHSSHGQELGSYSLSPDEEPRRDFTRIKRVDLMDGLYTILEECNIPVHFGKKMVHIEEHDESEGDNITVTFEDGSTDSADLLLGCDGIHSAVRTTYVDPDIVPEYTGVAGISCIFPVANLTPHKHDALFPLKGMHGTLTSNGIFMVIPCKPDESEVYWFFNRKVPAPANAADSRDGWQEHRADAVSNFKSAIMECIADTQGSAWGGFLADLVNATTSINFFPVFRLPLGHAWRRGKRCLLIGDAAHAMQPHAAQGVSMALEDVFLLSKALKLEVSLEESLGRYDRVRRPRVEKIYNAAARNGGHLKQSKPWELWMKEQVLKWGMWLGNLFGSTFMKDDLLYDVEQEDLTVRD